MLYLTEPEPPVRLEKMEETTNKISLALEIREEALRTKLGRCFLHILSCKLIPAMSLFYT